MDLMIIYFKNFYFILYLLSYSKSDYYENIISEYNLIKNDLKIKGKETF